MLHIHSTSTQYNHQMVIITDLFMEGTNSFLPENAKQRKQTNWTTKLI